MYVTSSVLVGLESSVYYRTRALPERKPYFLQSSQELHCLGCLLLGTPQSQLPEYLYYLMAFSV